jgi:hypothetical protein
MSEFPIETVEQRRERYLRLSRAAADMAAKTPLPGPREMYLKLAHSWATMAEEETAAIEGDAAQSQPHPGEIAHPSSSLNGKLNQAR